MYLAELVLRIGQECENVGKSLAKELGLSPPSGLIEDLNFPRLGTLLCTTVPLKTKTVEVRWIYQSLTNKLLSPFDSWSTGTSTNPAWYVACNGLNHDRNANYMIRVGFNLVLESAFLKIGQHNVELIHIPSNPAPSHFQLHGHVHEKRPKKIVSNQLNLCVEVWDYKPAPEKAILSLLDKASKNEACCEEVKGDFFG